MKVKNQMNIRRGILAACWLLSLIVISFYGGTVSYGIFLGLTFIPLLSFFYIFCVFLCYRIYQKIGSRSIICGQSVPYYFILKNESWFAFAGIRIFFFSDFSYVEKLPEEIEYELLPGEQYQYETSLVCKYRGEYEVGIKEIVITDFFRLFRIKCAVREERKVIVAPKLVQISELKSVPDISAMLQRDDLRSTELDAVVREYAEGDALKQIHWKATARVHKLMSRKPVGEEKRGAVLIFDTKRYDNNPAVYLPIENKMLEIVLALSLFMSKNNVPVSYFYHQNDGVKNMRQGSLYGLGDIGGFYEQIRELHFDTDSNMKTDLAKVFRDGLLMDKAVVFFVLHQMDEEILKMTYQLADNGTFVIYYAVTDENVERFTSMSNPGRRIIAIAPEEELEEVL